MIIFNVTKDKVSVKQDDILNRGEYNVTKCKFLFSKEYDGLVKEAIFFIEEKNIGILLDENDECNIPQEAFEFRGNIEIGLYAYYTNNDKLEKRYSPSRITKVISDGSYTSEIDNTEEITPTDKEQMNSIIKNNVEEIKRLSTNKVDKVEGYNLSENNFSNMYKKKLDGIEQNAQVNKIEKIFINDDEIPIVEKNINITIPTTLTDLKNDNYFVNDKNYVHTDNNFTHAEKEKLKELNNYDDSSLNEKIVENSNSILENKKDIQNLKETSEKNTSNINEFNENLQNYSLVTETGYKLDLSIDNSTYIMTLKLLDKNENVLSTGEIDLPIESMIINVSYDSNVKRLTFYLQNGNVIKVPLNDLISGLVTEENLEETLKEYALKKDIPKNLSELENDSNYVKNTDYATSSIGGVVTLNNYFGIDVATKGQLVGSPKSYSAYTNSENRVLISKGTLENVIEGKKLETKANKVVAVSKNSTDEEYPSAKCTYEIKKDLEKLKDEILEIGEVSDSYIHVEDSTMSKLKSLSVEGICHQETTDGTNLCDLNVTQNDKVVYNSDGTITINGAGGFTLNFSQYNFKANTTYYMKWQLVSGTVDYWQVFMSPFADKWIEKDKFISFTSDTDMVLSGLWVHENAKFTNAVIKIWFATAEKDFEKFTGGKASPSIDYEQPIKTIEGNLNLTICNKNLCDGINQNIWIASTTNQYGVSVGNYGLCIKVDGISSYTISSNVIQERYRVGFSKENPLENIKNCVIYSRHLLDNTQSSVTMSSVGYKYLIVNATDLSNIQIDKNDKTTPFEQHLKSQITANIPKGEFIGGINDTYKDTISIELQDDEKYHLILNKMVYREIYDGSEDWAMTYGEHMFNLRTSSRFISRINSYSNYCIYNSTQSNIYNALKDNEFALQKFTNNNNVSSYTIFLKFMSINNVKEFKTWLSTHNIEVYYALEDPYMVDLGIVDMPFSFDEVTNIFTDSELLPRINATYYKNFISTIKNLKVNNETLKNELVSINNRLAALENANASAISDEESEVTSNE